MTSSKVTHPARYRVYQFFAALKAYLPAWAGGLRGELSTSDRDLVNSILTMPSQRRLFDRMSPNDQRHAIAVARTVQQAGHSHPALLQAALLHDVAKSLGQPLIHRVIIVLLEAFRPQLLVRLSNPTSLSPSPARNTNPPSIIPDPSSFPWWQRPFIIHAHHPAIGADWAKAAYCDALTVELILNHQAALTSIPEDNGRRLLEILQWADNLN
ncbi:MAG: hypothetical protein KDJ65_15330 [Anaerolineae bacterium]|nr:hypothetical protein [Anaerolineae bacterium]